MKIALLFMVSVLFADGLMSQNVKSVFSVETRAGYSTNTFLHPNVKEWDTSDDGAFARIIPSVQLFWNRSGYSAEGSVGYLHDSIFDERNSWGGMFGTARLLFTLTGSVSAGVEAMGSRMTSEFSKQSVSVLPEIRWSPSMFTSIKARGGSIFREYSGIGEGDGTDFNDRYDLMGLEVEHWPTLKWQIRGAVYGPVGERLIENQSVSLSFRRLINREMSVGLSFSANRYTNRFDLRTEADGLPIGPAQPDAEGEMIEQMDQLLQSGLRVLFPLFGNITGSGTAATQTFRAGNGDQRSDITASIGVSYSISGSGVFNRRKDRLEPTWTRRKDEAVVVSVEYGGDGQLYMTGDFNDWQRPGVAMSRQKRKRYAVQLELAPGMYEYKVVLLKDEKEVWVELSDEIMTVDDGYGGLNGLIFIED